jgi:hypothetical protein
MRDGKGMKDRVTMLPETVVQPLQEHLRYAKRLHHRDLQKELGFVYLRFGRPQPIG